MKNSSLFLRLRPVAAGVAALVLTGCATFSTDGGLDAVSTLTEARTGQAVTLSKPENATQSQDQIKALLSKPLTADTAIELALLNSPDMQAALAELGISEADLVQTGRMRNPSFAFSRLSGGDSTEIDRSVMFDLVGLLTIPLRTSIENDRFEQAKLQAATRAVRLAGDVRKAYFAAVAAQQQVKYMEQVSSATQAGAELAQRMAAVGNWNKLDQAREQVFHAEAIAQVARAKQEAVSSREHLARLLGLWGAQTAFTLPERLPELPKKPPTMEAIEAQAMRQRLDVQLAIKETEMTARALGLTKATGFINVLHGGYTNSSETGVARTNGYEIELELPIFDWGGAKRAKAQSIYMRSLQQASDIAIRARSQAREAYLGSRTAYDLARHYRDEILPLRKAISEEMVLRYNGMFISVFELLADAREQIHSVNAAIAAQRDYWMSEADLQAALSGTGGSSIQFKEPKASAEASATH